MTLRHLELRYWSKELGVTPERIKETVKQDGANVTDTRKGPEE
jgi:hypothetical protein